MKLGGFIIASLFTAVSAVILYSGNIALAFINYLAGFGLYFLWTKKIR